MASTIDIELFISEVKRHPVIWNRNSDDNRDKKLRDRAWREIAAKFVDLDSMGSAEKYELLKKLMCKWRNMRDAFVRGKRRAAAGESNKKNYMYARQLSFLEDIYSKSNQFSDDTKQDTDDSGASETEEQPSMLTVKSEFLTQYDPITWSDDDDIPIKRQRRNSDVQNTSTNSQMRGDVANFAQANLHDEDMLFFLSLLPAVKQFNMDQKLEFRTDLLKLIKQYRKEGSNSGKEQK